ncbi:MAG TPA: ribonucleotide-diphosphate reductase subunit beta [Thermoleophilaceae bacterium]|jgi:ribonucleotide reductase beta subunit family protein with ferritin-like domain/putative sterol carrier protein
MATATETRRMAIDDVSYEDLYRRWEQGNWSAYDLDFTQDRVDWHETFGDLERRAALWNYALFFHGEDSVTDNLSPYIDAAPLEEQKYFLATQQVDEARHSVFFKRFMHEVVEAGDGTVAGSLEATRPELTWGFRKTFDLLDDVADSLRRDRSIPNFARAITMYHLIVEASLAQPGQHFIEGYVTERGILPGFGAGMVNISRDEQRHIGFGVKCLSDLLKQDPDCAHAVAGLIREVRTFAAAVFVPPNWDRRYTEVFGKTAEEIYETGLISLEQKLRAAGLPLEEMPGAPPIPIDLTPRERAQRALAMLQAGYLGEKTGPPDPHKAELLFDILKRSVDTSGTNGSPTTIAWEFRDAEPWFLRIDNGSTEAQAGRVENADLTFRCRFEDWVDIVAQRRDPRIAMATGKLRPRGNLRLLLRMQKLFGR